MLVRVVDGLVAQYRAGQCAQVGDHDPGKLERVPLHGRQQGEPDVDVRQPQKRLDWTRSWDSTSTVGWSVRYRWRF